MEGFAIIAEYLGEEEGYDTISNFQGPFSLHTVMARALRVASNRLRVRTAPNSGGAFGVKLVLYVPIVLMCVAARVSGLVSAAGAVPRRSWWHALLSRRASRPGG
jgi:2-furoyl-CoA dehydrogenase large subunit